jgi:hypothetical protein
LYAELVDVITHKWGIPLLLETELEALRTAKEQGQHYLGLQPSVAAKLSSGVTEAEACQHLRETWAPIMLEEGQEDVGCNHKGAAGFSYGSSTASTTNGASGSSQHQAANGHAASPPQPTDATRSGTDAVICIAQLCKHFDVCCCVQRPLLCQGTHLPGSASCSLP